ncbi:secreted phosphoprotein 24 isoform 1-T1 [Lycodopsis pacificus]
MRSYALLLALLQSLGCSGIPLHTAELEALADRGLGAALAEVNAVYAANHLYRVTRGSVTRIIPMGLNTADLLLVFGIKETECVKASRNEPQTCAFRPGFFVPSLSCSSRVRMSATSTQVVSLRCGRDSSSSSSSSTLVPQMISRGRHQFNIPFVNRAVPAPPAPPPSPQPGRFLQGQRAEAWPRGDTFTNYLV